MKRNLNDLHGYFTQLSAWEGKPTAVLIASWKPSVHAAITADLRHAFRSSGVMGSPLPVSVGNTNQRVGNRVASAVAKQIGPKLRKFRLETCKGQGYPDMRLSRRRNQCDIALELKATRRFDPRSNSRIVLTSASRKLRKKFRCPTNHLLLTICYRRNGGRFWVRGVRLDFLEPTTQVHVRLEASLTRKSLAKSDSSAAWIGVSQEELGPKSDFRE